MQTLKSLNSLGFEDVVVTLGHKGHVIAAAIEAEECVRPVRTPHQPGSATPIHTTHPIHTVGMLPEARCAF